jgi:hypothetical protein
MKQPNERRKIVRFFAVNLPTPSLIKWPVDILRGKAGDANVDDAGAVVCRRGRPRVPLSVIVVDVRDAKGRMLVTTPTTT